ncbi:hypothetical protein HG536_0D04200 [Torulaspora globosa]|uniref:Endoplasmic reticulum lectin n=1 Tax=Torulaspora globosa TaxID=48254 RepID=A0A7G3ZHB2_9SACH|nr:uncharacterized protein HG536_0D04200 [Torulaspora globosa]QLL32898.1 hypothetical protein HG536_0D04200 [Torulaspora globosa]
MWGLLMITCLVSAPMIAAILAPLEDLYASEKYLISYVPSQDWQNSIANNASALSLGKITELGDNFSCYIPTAAAKDHDTVAELNEKDLDAVLSSNLKNGIELITQSFNGCISYLSGFWNYDFCSDTGLAQFHGNSKTTSLYYVLGRAKSSAADREFQLLYNDLGYYISEIMGSGDICDVTGRPRVVEVQYICRPTGGPASIQWVREVKTCHYEIQVAVPQLCSLELLSKNGDDDVSGSIVCAKTQENRENSGLIETIGYYKPTFIGNELYLLEPHLKESFQNRTALMYTGKLSITDALYEESYGINEKFASAIGRMLFQHLLLSPDQSPYEPGDKFAWMSEVLDSKGQFLTMVGFNLTSSLAEIVIDDSLHFTGPGNFLFYERTNVEKRPSDDLLATRVPMIDGKDGFALFHTESLYLVADPKVKEIVEHLIGSDDTVETFEGE